MPKIDTGWLYASFRPDKVANGSDSEARELEVNRVRSELHVSCFSPGAIYLYQYCLHKLPSVSLNPATGMPVGALALLLALASSSVDELRERRTMYARGSKRWLFGGIILPQGGGG